MSEENNTYWKGIPGGLQNNAASVPTPQPEQTTQPAVYAAPPSPYKTVAAAPVQPAQPAQPVQQVQPVQPAAQPYATAPMQQPSAQPVAQPVAYAAPPSPYGVPAATTAPVASVPPVQQAPYMGWGAVPVQQPLSYGAQQTPPYPLGQTRKTSGMAIASMVLGIVALVSLGGSDDFYYFVWIVCSFLALGFSIAGLSKTSPKKPTCERGRGMAMAGLVLSIVNICLMLLFITFAILFSLSMASHYGSMSDTSQTASFIATLASLS